MDQGDGRPFILHADGRIPFFRFPVKLRAFKIFRIFFQMLVRIDDKIFRDVKTDNCKMLALKRIHFQLLFFIAFFSLHVAVDLKGAPDCPDRFPVFVKNVPAADPVPGIPSEVPHAGCAFRLFCTGIDLPDHFPVFLSIRIRHFHKTDKGIREMVHFLRKLFKLLRQRNSFIGLLFRVINEMRHAGMLQRFGKQEFILLQFFLRADQFVDIVIGRIESFRPVVDCFMVCTDRGPAVSAFAVPYAEAVFKQPFLPDTVMGFFQKTRKIFFRNRLGYFVSGILRSGIPPVLNHLIVTVIQVLHAQIISRQVKNADTRRDHFQNIIIEIFIPDQSHEDSPHSCWIFHRTFKTFFLIILQSTRYFK